MPDMRREQALHVLMIERHVGDMGKREWRLIRDRLNEACFLERLAWSGTRIDMHRASHVPGCGVLEVVVQQICVRNRLDIAIRAVARKWRRQPVVAKTLQVPEMNMRIDKRGPRHQ